MTRRPDTDPFGPIETVVTALLALFVGSLLLFGVIAVVDQLRDGSTNASIATIGDPEACVLVDNEIVPSSTDGPERGIRRDIASVYAERLNLCIQDPTWFQKTSSALGPVGDLIFLGGSLLLLRGAIRAGRRNGLFTLALAQRVQQLAWFLLFMTLVWPFVAAAGRGVVIEAAVPEAQWTEALFRPDIPFSLAVVAFGLFTVSRILRRAVLLQEEVDATV